jgi:hypothetical protein
MDCLLHDVIKHHILEILHPDDYLTCLFTSRKVFHPIDSKQYQRKFEQLNEYTTANEMKIISLNVQKRQEQLKTLQKQIFISKYENTSAWHIIKEQIFPTIQQDILSVATRGGRILKLSWTYIYRMLVSHIPPTREQQRLARMHISHISPTKEQQRLVLAFLWSKGYQVEATTFEFKIKW